MRTRPLLFALALVAHTSSVAAQPAAPTGVAPPAGSRVVFLLRQPPEAPRSRDVLRTVRRRFTWASPQPAFSSQRPAALRALFARANRRADGAAPVPDLTRFYSVSLPPGASAQALLRMLRAHPDVETAYLSMPSSPPAPG